MQPSTFLTWVQESTFAGVPLWSLLVALTAMAATYVVILAVLYLVTGRAKVWATHSQSAAAMTVVQVLEGTSRLLMFLVRCSWGRVFWSCPVAGQAV